MADRHNEYRWRKISTLFRQYNPICQFVSKDTGQQCNHASEIVHHLTDPKIDPKVFYSWSNMVALCKEHHAGGEIGETQGNLYCHSVGPNDAVYPQSARMFPCWHKDHRPRPNPLSEPAGFLPPGAVASSVGDDILNRALAMEI